MRKPWTGTPRMEGEPETRICKQCGQEMPIESYYFVWKYRLNGEKRGYRQPYCHACRLENCRRSKLAAKNGIVLPPIQRIKAQESERVKDKVTCRENCEFYPCFKGIDTMRSNLALTCNQFKEKANEKFIP